MSYCDGERQPCEGPEEHPSLCYIVVAFTLFIGFIVIAWFLGLA